MMALSFFYAGFLVLGIVAPVHTQRSWYESRRGGLQYAITGRSSILRRDDIDPTTLYPAHNISVPIDHFHNDTKYAPHSHDTFPLRYWYDATYYQPGGPVIVLASGETSGTDRLPYMQKGILAQLAQATGGLSVILEHRYYGTSFPVPDLSIENLRFLTTEQALADSAFFAENVVFEGLPDECDLSPDATPWIAYGGSYAGAFVAFLRVVYPEVFYGAISSSGVPEAIIDYWQYWLGPLNYGPKDCMNTTQELVEVIDGILIGKNDSELTTRLKTVFQLDGITYDNDFASALAGYGVGGWQGRNWDPNVTSPAFDQYCAAITNDTLIYPATSGLRDEVLNLTEISGYSDISDVFVTRLLNWIGYLNATLSANCAGVSLDRCVGTHNQTFYDQVDFSQQSWRSWGYQYCTEWGYYQTGSGFPADIKPLVSRTIDVEYSSIICRDAFNLTGPPDVDAINKYGGWSIEYDRLAFVDGQADPWRYAGPHAPEAPKRKSTTNTPFILIERAVHHWDENGLFPNETTTDLPPAPVKDAQEAEASFVKQWVSEFSQS